MYIYTFVFIYIYSPSLKGVPACDCVTVLNFLQKN